MGAIVSCFEAVFRAIGQVLMAIVNGVGTVIMAIVHGIVAVFDIIISCLTCQGFGGRKGRHRGTTSAV